MQPREYILQQAEKNKFVRSAELSRALKITRQTLAYHLRKLLSDRKLIKTGSTRNARYSLFRPENEILDQRKERSFASDYSLKDLSEDRVFDEANIRLNLKKILSESAYRIVSYAFTEMLNNAIDHSRASKARVSFKCADGTLEFQVVDHGVGVYEKIREKFGFKNHFDAVEHLLKGKQTTDPQKHSGQGIFFTSKIADKFILESSGLRLVMDNKIDDVILKDVKDFRGTKVIFCIKQKTKKSLKKVFDEYTDSDYEFDKTKITIHLSSRTGEYVARSQAKRLLFGLEKFKRIVLDFAKVEGVGQGFVDEIFRVFQNSHANIELQPINASPSVSFMIKRVLSERPL